MRGLVYMLRGNRECVGILVLSERTRVGKGLRFNLRDSLTGALGRSAAETGTRPMRQTLRLEADHHVLGSGHARAGLTHRAGLLCKFIRVRK